MGVLFKRRLRDSVKMVKWKKRIGVRLIWWFGHLGSTISVSSYIVPEISIRCLNCSSDFPDPIFDASMVWSFHWEKPITQQWEDIWISTILPTGYVMILGNTGYVVTKTPNTVSSEAANRSQRPALMIQDNYDRYHSSI